MTSDIAQTFQENPLGSAGELVAQSVIPDDRLANMSNLTGDALMRAVLGIEDPKDRTSQTRREPKKLMYFKLCDGSVCSIHPQSEGWITMGPASGVITAQEHAEFIEAKHATPLIRYGRHDLGKVNNPAVRYGPLISEGGIAELPLVQMRAFGWHHIPSVVALIPELGETIEYYCENGCPKTGKRGRWFLSEDDLKKHTGALHQDAAAPAAVGHHIVKALKDVSSFQAMDAERLVKTVVAGIKEFEESKLEVAEPEEEQVPEVEEPTKEPITKSDGEIQEVIDSLNELTESEEGN